MKGKIICVLRISTERQEIASQKAEMVEFIKAIGYKEKDIIYVTGEGASAIKLNEKYMQMISDIRNYVNNGVRAVAVWHLNRLGRNDTVLTEFKNFFIENKVQLYCKEPSLRLLNDDGTVNTGAELAYGLFSVMVKQDMIEKQAKFKRAKDYKRKKGLYVGGNIKYGYTIDENKMMVVKEDEAKIIRLIYELYASGKYSMPQLMVELKERGITIATTTLSRILSNKTYMGNNDGNYLIYPPIISEEIYNKVKSVRNNNNKNILKSKVYKFGVKLLKCPICGGNIYVDSNHYTCYAHRRGKFEILPKYCDNKLAADADVVDSILWFYASIQHQNYLLNVNENNVDEYKKELDVINEKLNEVDKKIEGVNKRKNRVMSSYFNGEIDTNTKNVWLQKISVDTIELKKKQTTLTEQKERQENIINRIKNDIDALMNADIETMLSVVELQDRKEMYEIVHQHISGGTITEAKIELENRTYKGFKLEFNDQVYYYAANKRFGDRLFKLVNGKYSPVTIDKVQNGAGIYLDKVVTV